MSAATRKHARLLASLIAADLDRVDLVPPAKNLRRAERRAHSERKKQFALQVHGFASAWRIDGWQAHAIKRADHMAACSCEGCGARRRYEGASIQEKRFACTGGDE
jgi:hypothetical protein